MHKRNLQLTKYYIITLAVKIECAFEIFLCFNGVENKVKKYESSPVGVVSNKMD